MATESKETLRELLSKTLKKLHYTVELPLDKNRVVVQVSTNSVADRNEELKSIYETLSSTKSLLESVTFDEFKERSSISKAGSFRVYYSDSSKIYTDVTAKPNGTASRGSAIKAVDYLSACTTFKTLDLGKFGEMECYYFDTPKKLQDVIVKSMERSSVFSCAHREIVNTLFTEGSKVSEGLDSFELKSIKNIQNLLVSFGELYVPWLFLKKRVNRVNSLPDFSGNNVVAVAFPKFDLAKIDCIILYKSRNKIKHLYFSMKVGKGHEPSLIDFIKSDTKINWTGVNATLANIQKYFKTLPSNMGVMKGCCMYYMKQSKCFKSNTYSDVYGKISKAFESRKTITTTELNEFKTWLCNYAKNSLGISTIDKSFYTNYPFSIPRLIALFIKTECEKERCSRMIIEQVMQGGYFQLRINSTSAKSGILKFEIIPIEASANATVKFAITNGYTDFRMSSGNHFVGYTIS